VAEVSGLGLLLLGLAALPAPRAERMAVGVTLSHASPADLDRIAQAGFVYVRTDLAWSEVEQRPDTYEFGSYDALVEGLGRRGMAPILVLAYGNDIHGGGAPRTPEARGAYARFAAAAAARYSGRGVLWQVWNEPNLWQFWDPPDPAEYVALARETAGAIRAADPGAYVIGPATGGPEFDLGFLDAAFGLGLLDALDAVSVHPFGAAYPEAALPFYAAVRGLMDHHSPGRRIPLLCGEWGYSIPDQDLQAQYLVRSLEVNQRAGIPLTVWYAWQDDGFQDFGLLDTLGRPKKSLLAAEAWLRPGQGRAARARPPRP
jgi:polysaccharide biosynthesis protein PslG